MSANKIGHVPEPVLSIHTLLELDVSNNELHQLPESIGSLGNLVKLNISGTSPLSDPPYSSLLTPFFPSVNIQVTPFASSQSLLANCPT